jgi:4-amino-4-deoxy-L-arabinose transferase-like glycosyltransferase
MTLADGTARASTLDRVLLWAALAIALALGARGISAEAITSLQGDMPRYLMDGVFFRDFLASGPGVTLSGMLEYAQRYYARYPALSIGHHPPLLPLALVPFFATFGVSIASGRLAILAFFLLAVWQLHVLGRRVYGRTAAGWACILFASHPFIVRFGQQVLSEMPAIALVLVAVNAAFRFRETGRFRHYLGLLAAIVLSLAARQLAVFVTPVYAAIVLDRRGWVLFARRSILLCTVALGITFVAVAIATFAFSPFNVAVVLAVLHHDLTLAGTLTVLRIIAANQIGLALAVVCTAGLLSSWLMRDRRIVFITLWIVCVVGAVVVFTGPIEPDRYSILAVPAYCLAAATLTVRARAHQIGRAIGHGVLLAATCWQLAVAASKPLVEADGYEQAAAFVVSQGGAPTVLFSGPVDTGYFVFFVRKHDPAQRLIVLRSDKVLTTSEMGDVDVEERISRREEIYDVLRRFGTRFVVIEDRPAGSRVLDWLRDELRTAHFAERERFHIRASDYRLRGVDLVVYEYLQATAPDADATIDLHLPVVGRDIHVPLSDLQTSAGRPASRQP